MRRSLIGLAAALALVGVFTGGLAWLLTDPRPPAGAPRGERLWYAYCATCHGVDGRGSWRALLFLIRPGDLTDGARMRTWSDAYLLELLRHGGAPIGRPGMPAFGSQLSGEDLAALVAYVRTLPGRVSVPAASRS